MTDENLGDMELVETSTPIDLTTWFYGRCNTVELTEIMRNQMLADPPRISFPYMWAPESDGRRGRAPRDPVMIYLDLPLAANSDERCCYACSLEELIDDIIELHQNCETKKIEDDGGRFVVQKITARLRELADKLEQSVKP